jgi:hypothetical protein
LEERNDIIFYIIIMARAKSTARTNAAYPSPGPQRQDLTPHLTPVETLKDLLREQPEQDVKNKELYQEFQLGNIITLPTNHGLKDFVDLFWKEQEGTYDYYRYIWTSPDVFVRLEGTETWTGNNGVLCHDIVPECFRISLWAPNRSRVYLCIYAKSKSVQVTASINTCLEYLLHLRDNYYTKLGLSPTYLHHNALGAKLQLPLMFDKFLEANTESREISLEGFHLSNETYAILWECEKNLNVAFDSCDIGDMDSSLENTCSSQKGPGHLTLTQDPFGGDEAKWLAFLNGTENSRLGRLTLCRLEISSPQVCLALARQAIRRLELNDCKMSDGGRSIIDTMNANTGPRELILSYPHRLDSFGTDLGVFGSLEQWRLFFNALCGNSHLECLTINRKKLGSEEWLALAASLKENLGLQSLTISDAFMDEHCWNALMTTLSRHPNIRELHLLNLHTYLPYNAAESSNAISEESQRRIGRVSELLSTNRRIDAMSMSGRCFDRDLWDLHVLPKLRHNLYQKRRGIK